MMLRATLLAVVGPFAAAQHQTEWCPASPQQMCRMMCRDVTCQHENECAMRNGNCCDMTCECKEGFQRMEDGGCQPNWARNPPARPADATEDNFAHCTSYNDGCNTCRREGSGMPTACTEMMCFRQATPFCQACEAGFELSDGTHPGSRCVAAQVHEEKLRPLGSADPASTEVNCCGGGAACGYVHCPALGAGTEGCVRPWVMPNNMDFETDCPLKTPAVAVVKTPTLAAGDRCAQGFCENPADCPRCSKGFSCRSESEICAGTCYGRCYTENVVFTV